MADSKSSAPPTTATDDKKGTPTDQKARAPSYDERPTLFSTLSNVYGTPLSPTTAGGGAGGSGEAKLPAHVNQWVLVNHPAEMPGRDDAKLQRVPFPTDVPHGSVLVKVNYLTVDPYLRNAFRPLFYGRPNPTNSILRTEGVGQVIRSEHPQFKIGDKVQGFFGWRDYAVIEGSNIAKVNVDWPESHCLGALGMPGATAYYGLFEVCKPKPGDVLFVSAASGAVGALVGQLGKLAGCTVIGSVGSADKVQYCKTLGFDAVISYKDKDTEALVKEIKEAAPGGIHCYFDNTGGPVTEAVMLSLCEFGRVAVCGQISYYNLPQPARIDNGLALFQQILSKRATVQGFLVHQFRPWDSGLNRLAKWIQNGDIKVAEDVTVGIENMFDAFLGLFSGQNLGKKTHSPRLNQPLPLPPPVAVAAHRPTDPPTPSIDH